MKLLFALGTRPEAIKVIPVIKKARERGHKALLCASGQHEELVNPIFTFFSEQPASNLKVMSQGQSLAALTAKIVTGYDQQIAVEKPDMVIVQGDTTTTLGASLAAFYQQVPVAHIEAGLRTHDPYSPFPEEVNRQLVSRIAKFHFPPTPTAQAHLRAEGINQNVTVTGNTAIDALKMALKMIENQPEDLTRLKKTYPFVNDDVRTILVTVHRRENHGPHLDNICKAFAHIAKAYDNVQLVIPVHYNPNVLHVIKQKLGNIKNIHLIEPLAYQDFLWMMAKSYMIFTDSGGVQEEAPSLNKPIVVMRTNTERQEGVEAGTSILGGVDFDRLVSCADKLLQEQSFYDSMAQAQNPYGDGTASEQILSQLEA